MAKVSRKLKKEIADKKKAYKSLEKYLAMEQQKEDKSEYLIGEFKRISEVLKDWIFDRTMED